MSRLSRRVIATAAALGMAAAYPGLALAASPATGAMQNAPAAKTESSTMAKSESTPMAKPMAPEAKAKAAESEHWTAWNSRVRDAQEALNKQANDKLVVDGKLGPKTRAAIKAFQAKNGLKPTGTLNKATLAKLHVAPHSA